MGLFKIICWALIFLTRLRFPPGSSIATILKTRRHFGDVESEMKTENKRFDKTITALFNWTT